MSLVSKSILAEILCVLFTLTSLFASDWKKVQANWIFLYSLEWNKNMCSCATTDTGHAQRSYLTVARVSVA